MPMGSGRATDRQEELLETFTGFGHILSLKDKPPGFVPPRIHRNGDQYLLVVPGRDEYNSLSGTPSGLRYISHFLVFSPRE